MNLRAIRLLLKHQGLGWAAYRARNVIEHKLGTLEKRAPALPWSAFRLMNPFADSSLEADDHLGPHWREHRRPFLFEPSKREFFAPPLRAFDEADPDWPARRLEEIAAGKLSYFSNPPVEVGFPPQWNDNLLEGMPGPAMVHFSRIDEFGCGDAKCTWEPNRFGFALDLARIYWRTGDERAAELFWDAVEDWHKHNPPNTGINWKCGQESSLRAMAWCFGLWGFAESEHTTDSRIAMAYQLMAATARRVEAHIRYAVSQQNNHGVSEAMGLFTIGTLFPELDGADRWQQRGRALLESQARDLIDEDGGFSQYSANYHRVMLHDYLYAIRIGEVNDAPLSEELKQRVDRSGRFIEQVQDMKSGHVPRYGNDDGALILPLTNCDYDDFRPVVQSVAAMAGRALPWEAGPWDEALLWFGYNDAPRGVPSSRSNEVPHDFQTGDAGCQVLRSANGMAMMRAGGGRFRPAQLDQLHVDIRHRGINIALDPGTYSYNAAGEWADIPLATAAAHNSIMIDGVEHAERISRFLFLPPPMVRVECFERSAAGNIAMVEASLDVYRNLPDPASVRRALIQLGSAHWLVVDFNDAARPHDVAVAWNLTDLPHEWNVDAHRLALILPDLSANGALTAYHVAIASTSPAMLCRLTRASNRDWRGWRAGRYHSLAPCLRLDTTLTASQAIVATAFGPGISRIAVADRRIDVTLGDHAATISLRTDRTGTQIASITLEGPESDTLILN